MTTRATPTNVPVSAHAIVRGEREYWCAARPHCSFTATELSDALRHVTARQHDARHLAPVPWAAPEPVA